MPRSKNKNFTGYTTLSLDKAKLKVLFDVLDENEIPYRSMADAVYIAIERYVHEFKVKS